jgi:outer membrane protein assembly factor BamB
VIVTGGAGAGPTLLAFSRADGQPLWHSGADAASYASPILATLAGKRMIVSSNAATLTFHEPSTGALLLEHPWTDGKRPKASQPVVLPGDRVFLSAGYGIGCVMLQIAAAGDGRLSATELWKNLRMKTQFNSAASGMASSTGSTTACSLAWTRAPGNASGRAAATAQARRSSWTTSF